ncbi:MAG TPA: polysaccharide deacetylase family protein [Gemmatimonadales bacterium]|nr:polysaccharide deacetylase family protein [Gemmatimonadales bacterium]
MRRAQQRRGRPLVASLGYHDVTDTPAESGFQRDGAVAYKLGVAQFAHQLDWITAGRLAPSLVTDIDLTRPGRHLLLTFDDGGKSALTISEELSRRGWRGHFFITTGLIGRRTFLSREEIREIRRLGHVVGSHSHNHPDIYRELTWEQMVVEWRKSSDILAQLLGEPCCTGAVPGGEISDRVFRSAGAAGLRHVFTSEPTLRPRVVGGCWVLGRFCVKRSTTPADIARLIRFQGWTRKLLIRKLRTAASRSLPSLHRLYVSRSTQEWLEPIQ